MLTVQLGLYAMLPIFVNKVQHTALLWLIKWLYHMIELVNCLIVIGSCVSDVYFCSQRSLPEKSHKK